MTIDNNTSNNEKEASQDISMDEVADAYEGKDNIENDKFESNEDSTSQAADHDVLVKLQEENAQLKDRALRALAEAENTRKRADRAQQDASKYAVSSFAKDMLDVADNLRRALDAVPEDQKEEADIKTLMDGVAATERSMLQAFERHKITKIEPTEGKFDPNFHEVMFEAEVPGKNPGEIIQLIEPGYVIHDRLLRAARVGVAKGSTDTKIDQEV